MPVSLLIAALALSSSAASYPEGDAKRLAAAVAGRTPGKPAFCIDQSRLQGPEVIDNRTIIYRQSGRRIWVSRLGAPCPWLRRDPILIVETFGTQLCRHDRFRVLARTSSIPSGNCFLGDLIPYDRPAGP